tara:strand:- start:806 stop:1060 length:255 start_codon:yes stop_codon:yes gene_type:complete
MIKIENIKNCSVVLTGFGDSSHLISDFLTQNNLKCENIITNNVKLVITAEDIDYIGVKSSKLKKAMMSGIPIISLDEINKIHTD